MKTAIFFSIAFSFLSVLAAKSTEPSRIQETAEMSAMLCLRQLPRIGQTLIANEDVHRAAIQLPSRACAEISTAKGLCTRIVFSIDNQNLKRCYIWQPKAVETEELGRADDKFIYVKIGNFLFPINTIEKVVNDPIKFGWFGNDDGTKIQLKRAQSLQNCALTPIHTFAEFEITRFLSQKLDENIALPSGGELVRELEALDQKGRARSLELPAACAKYVSAKAQDTTSVAFSIQRILNQMQPTPPEYADLPAASAKPPAR